MLRAQDYHKLKQIEKIGFAAAMQQLKDSRRISKVTIRSDCRSMMILLRIHWSAHDNLIADCETLDSSERLQCGGGEES